MTEQKPEVIRVFSNRREDTSKEISDLLDKASEQGIEVRGFIPTSGPYTLWIFQKRGGYSNLAIGPTQVTEYLRSLVA